MSFTNADLLALKAELTNDPKHLGLTTNAADDGTNADKLNAVAALPIKRRSLSAADLLNAIDPLEHEALTTQQARYLDSVLLLQQIDPFLNTNLISGLVGNSGMFASDSTSGTNITAAIQTVGSRIDQMFQAGLLSVDQPVTPSDIANARNAA